MSQKNNKPKDQKDQTQNMSQNTILPPPQSLPNDDCGPSTELNEGNNIEFNFETPSPISNISNNSILYQKYSNKQVEGVDPEKNNNYGYVVYPTLDQNDNRKYDEYLKDLSNIFKSN